MSNKLKKGPETQPRPTGLLKLLKYILIFKIVMAIGVFRLHLLELEKVFI